MFFHFLFFELRIACQLIIQCPRVSCLPDGVYHKEDPHCHQNYCEDKRPWMRLRMKWLIQKLWIRKPFFSQASCKVASFPLVLDLMHKCYVVSFPDVFHFWIWRRNCFVSYIHISTSQKLRGNEIGILFLTLRTHENSKKLKLSSTNKTHVYPLLVIFDVLRRPYAVTEKSWLLGW